MTLYDRILIIFLKNAETQSEMCLQQNIIRSYILRA